MINIAMLVVDGLTGIFMDELHFKIFTVTIKPFHSLEAAAGIGS